jgi:hypothetical protein
MTKDELKDWAILATNMKIIWEPFSLGADVLALLTEHNEAIRLLKKILHVMENDGGYTPKMCEQLRDECCDDGGEPCRTLDEIRAFFEKERP